MSANDPAQREAATSWHTFSRRSAHEDVPQQPHSGEGDLDGDRAGATAAKPATEQYAAAGPVLAAVPVRPPTTASVTASVTDLNAATVAVCIHPVSHRMVVVGPFPGPDRAEQWWHARTNRFAETGARCHIIPLTAPLPGDGEPTSGGPA